MHRLWMLGLLVPIAVSAHDELPCEPPQVTMEVVAPEDVQTFFESKGLTVVTFLGYSGAEYEHPEELLEQGIKALRSLDRKTTVVNIGATAEGIGALYPEAKRLGFRTSGIVSTQAQEHAAALSPCLDYLFFVRDETWGGLLPDGKSLSPTSTAIVTASHSLIAIGGGDVARDEWWAAKRLGKQVKFIPADMNHRLAREKAAKKGQPEPKSFRGSLHDSFRQ